MADKQGTSDGTALGRLSAHVTALGGLVAVVVGVNSALTTCSNDTIARYTGFRNAVSAEEEFWKERFHDYFEALALENGPQRKAKLAALSALADHSIPDFSEYRFGLFDNPGARDIAVNRLEGMRASLKAAIGNPDSSDPEVAEGRRSANTFDSEERAPVQSRTGDVVTAEARAVTQAMVVPLPEERSAPSRETQVLSVGDAKGWDVDVFWCAGGGTPREALLYGEALDAAKRLKEFADAGNAIAPGVNLGRVRLRTLPELRQGNTRGYPNSGYVIRFDSATGEADAALALRAALAPLGKPFTVQPSRTPTSWYLSAFVCGDEVAGAS